MDSSPYIPTEFSPQDNSIAMSDPQTADLDTSLNTVDVIGWSPIVRRGSRLMGANPEIDFGYRQVPVNTNYSSIPIYNTEAPDPSYTLLSYDALIRKSNSYQPQFIQPNFTTMRSPMINEGM